MKLLTPKDYEELAKEAEAKYFEGSSLNDFVFEKAGELELNPEQIKQLCWQANTAVHLSLFEKKAEDKMIEFPVADPAYVMKRMYRPAEDQPMAVDSSTKIASDFFTPLNVNLEKVANVEFTVEPVETETSKIQRRSNATMTMRKVAEQLEDKSLQETELYKMKIAALGIELRKSNESEDLEKDAYALFGDSIIPILTDLRNARHEKETIENTKLASSVERLVDTGANSFSKLIEVKNHFENAIKAASAAKWTKENTDI